jgi:Ca2+-binding RTX toxin-like protein
VCGLAGNDHLKGADGEEVLVGGLGDDILVGNLGNDLLIGGSGDDHLLGQAGDDVLRGGSGNDFLFGGPDFDELDGGPDSDSCKPQGVADLIGCETWILRTRSRDERARIRTADLLITNLRRTREKSQSFAGSLRDPRRRSRFRWLSTKCGDFVVTDTSRHRIGTIKTGSACVPVYRSPDPCRKCVEIIDCRSAAPYEYAAVLQATGGAQCA